VANGDTVQFFAEFARGVEWLSWVSAQPEFKRLVDVRTDAGPCTWPLAYWFVQQYALDQTLTNAALTTVQDAGGRISETLWHALGHSLHARDAPREAWL